MKRILLVGAGRWGKIFIRNLSSHPLLELTGLVSSQDPKSISGLPPATKVFSSLELALENKSIDWEGVILATPPGLHANQLKACAQKKIPTLVEKPFTLSLREAKEVQNLGTPVLVDHIQIFHPAFEWMKKNIAASSIVKIKGAGGNMGPIRESYSALWDYGSHDLSLILELLQKSPTNTSVISNGNADGAAYTVSLTFDNGTQAEFLSSNISEQKLRSFEVETKGEIFRWVEIPVTKLWKKSKSTGTQEEISLPKNTPLEKVLEVFAQGLAGNKDSRWGTDLAIKVIASLEACEKAQA